MWKTLVSSSLEASSPSIRDISSITTHDLMTMHLCPVLLFYIPHELVLPAASSAFTIYHVYIRSFCSPILSPRYMQAILRGVVRHNIHLRIFRVYMPSPMIDIHYQRFALHLSHYRSNSDHICICQFKSEIVNHHLPRYHH